MTEYNAERSRAKRPLPLWVDAFLRDTQHLGPDEVGSYMLLLMAMWSREACDLPMDDAKLARICRVSKRLWKSRIWPSLEEYFAVENGALVSKRLRKEAVFIEFQGTQQSSRKRAEKSDKPLKNNKPPQTTDTTADTTADTTTDQPTYNLQPTSTTTDFTNVQSVVAIPRDPIETAVWDRGPPFLVGRGVPAEKARNMIGKWVRDCGAQSVFDALKEASQSPTQDPIPYISAILRKPRVVASREPDIDELLKDA